LKAAGKAGGGHVLFQLQKPSPHCCHASEGCASRPARQGASACAASGVLVKVSNPPLTAQAVRMQRNASDAAAEDLWAGVLPALASATASWGMYPVPKGYVDPSHSYEFHLF